MKRWLHPLAPVCGLALLWLSAGPLHAQQAPAPADAAQAGQDAEAGAAPEADADDAPPADGEDGLSADNELSFPVDI